MSTEQQTTCLKLGGVDTMYGGDVQKTVEIVGGFDKDLNLITENVVICNITKTFLKNKITEWDSFKDVYYDNNKLDTKYYNKLIETINNIYLLPFYCSDEKELANIISNIYNGSDKQIYTAISNTLNLLEPIKPVIKHLFMSYKIFIEKLIEIFVKLRNSYVDDSHTNDFKLLLEKWNAIDMENNINTSSLILFFNFPPKKVNLENSIKKIEWNIDNANNSELNNSEANNSELNNSEANNSELNNSEANNSEANICEANKLIDKFLNKAKSNNFFYCGFCPFIPLERFEILLRFPANDLINIIKLLDTKNIYEKSINEANASINNISKLNACISEISKLGNINIIKKQLPKENVTADKINNIKFFEKYVELYLDLYKQVGLVFIKKEQYICALIKKINIISKEVIDISNNIILKE
jgi:hypothetical protein